MLRGAMLTKPAPSPRLLVLGQLAGMMDWKDAFARVVTALGSDEPREGIFDAEELNALSLALARLESEMATGQAVVTAVVGSTTVDVRTYPSALPAVKTSLAILLTRPAH